MGESGSSRERPDADRLAALERERAELQASVATLKEVIRLMAVASAAWNEALSLLNASFPSAVPND